MYVPHACLVLLEALKLQMVVAAMWVLGDEPESSERTASALNH